MSNGFNDTTSGRPTDEEVNQWAEAERKRRQAWLAGPTATEKDEWARHRRRTATSTGRASNVWPTDEEVEDWARRERERRQRWAEGPTEAEKRAWADAARRRREADSFLDDTLPFGADLFDFSDPDVRRITRQAELASKGAMSLAISWPFALFSQLVRAGRAIEEDRLDDVTPRPAGRRRRIRLNED